MGGFVFFFFFSFFLIFFLLGDVYGDLVGHCSPVVISRLIKLGAAAPNLSLCLFRLIPLVSIVSCCFFLARHCCLNAASSLFFLRLQDGLSQLCLDGFRTHLTMVITIPDIFSGKVPVEPRVVLPLF